MDDDLANDSQELEPLTWVSPWNYPTRCTAEFNLAVAEMVMNGATIAAASMSMGVSPSRVREWLHWGEEAYNGERDGSDYHAVYLDLYLKYMQALGRAIVPLQQDMHHRNGQWWLQHHPEARGELGGDENQMLITPLPAAPDTVEAEIVPPKAPPEDLRVMLRTLIEAGAAVRGDAVEEEPIDIVVEPLKDDDESEGIA